MRDIKLLVFDFDGTLCDCVEVHYKALNKAIEEVAGSNFIISRDEQTSFYNGLSTKVKLDKLIKEKDLQADFAGKIAALKQHYTLIALEEEISENLSLRGDLLKLKEDGFLLYCASNAMRETVLLGLKKLQVLDLFDAIIGNDAIKRQKPHPDIFLQSFLAAGVSPEETLIIEDSHHGREAALASGAYLCEVDDPSQTTYEHIRGAISQISRNPRKHYAKNTLKVLIPMSGAGSRTAAKYQNIKPLIDINGKTMIERAVRSLNVDAQFIFIVQQAHYNKHNLGTYLRLIAPGCEIVQTDGLTEGAACSTLLAKNYIDNGHQLLIANCDQILEWSPQSFIFDAMAKKADGSILTFHKENDRKWSYVATDEQGFVTRIAEKDPISDEASIGLYYFKRGKDYVKAAEEMILANDRSNGEFYVAPVYNYLIKNGKKIVTHKIDENGFYPTGTVEDLEKVINNPKFRD